MPRKPNPTPDDEEQSKKFLETAKALEADKTGKNFAKAIEVVVPVKRTQKSKTKL